VSYLQHTSEYGQAIAWCAQGKLSPKNQKNFKPARKFKLALLKQAVRVYRLLEKQAIRKPELRGLEGTQC
jgi:hypothetical protein